MGAGRPGCYSLKQISAYSAPQSPMPAILVESDDYLYTCIHKGIKALSVTPPSATCPHVAVLVEGADSASSVTRENFMQMQLLMQWRC